MVLGAKSSKPTANSMAYTADEHLGMAVSDSPAGLSYRM